MALWVALALAVLPAARAETEDLPGKDIFGWVERVVIRPGKVTLKAKLDTGADTSSLDATHIRRFRRGERRYVRFTIEDPKTKEVLTLERPFIRRATIKQHEGEHQLRPVVAIDVCLGDHLLRKVEVSLIDRSRFTYPVLLGRNALEGVALVDPDLTFTQKPNCEMGRPRPR